MSVEHESMNPVAVAVTGSRRRLPGRTLAFLILFVAAWLLAFGMRWLLDLSSFGFGFWPLGGKICASLTVTAVLASVPLVVDVAVRRRWVTGGLAVLLAAVLGVASGWLSVGENNITAWYQLHRPGFLKITQLAESGQLGENATASFSVTGHVVALGTNNGIPIAYVPVYTGIPDCSAGYVWFSGPLDPSSRTVDSVSRGRLEDGFGCSDKLIQSVGDGWWFMV